jgi:hypothetical protein
MIGNVVQLRPHDVRWVAAKGPLGLVIRGPGALEQDDGEEVPF